MGRDRPRSGRTVAVRPVPKCRRARLRPAPHGRSRKRDRCRGDRLQRHLHHAQAPDSRALHKGVFRFLLAGVDSGVGPSSSRATRDAVAVPVGQEPAHRQGHKR
ncbi:MAG: hypothetical protein ACK55I_42210, partial [bacterium]